MDYSPPGFSVQGDSQARLLKQVSISFSKRSLRPGVEPLSPALAGGFITTEPINPLVDSWLLVGEEKKDFVNVSKIRFLRCGDYPGLSGRALNSVRCAISEESQWLWPQTRRRPCDRSRGKQSQREKMCHGFEDAGRDHEPTSPWCSSLDVGKGKKLYSPLEFLLKPWF